MSLLISFLSVFFPGYDGEKKISGSPPPPPTTPTLDGALLSCLGPYQEECGAPRREVPVWGVLLSNPGR